MNRNNFSNLKDRWKNDWRDRGIENISISASWQEIQFSSNFSVLVGILLGPTDFVESSEDILRATLFLSVGLKKRILISIFQNVWKVFVRIFNIYFRLRSNRRKIFVGTTNLNHVCDSTIICCYNIGKIWWVKFNT